MTGSPPAGGISGRILLLALFGLFALGNVLVPAFLGKTALAWAVAIAACGLLALLWRGERTFEARASWRTLGICLVIACILLLLGGEGRFFYANEDWQVRDAVLADLARGPWPFAYLTDRGEQLLRAPLGMYLLPALFGGGAELAMLAGNILLLALVLVLSAILFPKGRGIALAVFLAFSGLDIVGNLLVGNAGSLDHLERWAPSLQYSSVITLIFWVPQHALAGWFCALLYLLHRRGRTSLGTLAAAVSLTAIWSPLAMIGALPFLALATLRGFRDIGVADVVAGAAGLAVSVPALVYLAAGAQHVSSGFESIAPLTWALFFGLEVAPSLWILYRLRQTERFGLDSLALAAAMLALIPFFHIGDNGDFAMRASIVPLAILAASLVAGLIDADWQAHRRTAMSVILLLSLGAVTGVAEAARAFRYAPSPPPNCTLSEVWTRQTGVVAGIATYLAPIDALPAWLRPSAPARIGTRADTVCWARAWKTPR